MAAASISEFKLICPRDGQIQRGFDVTLSCHLSSKSSAVAMEIRWFKGTDCVCLYKNEQVTEGRGYKGRVSLFTQELQRGNVSLQLRDIRQSDQGQYWCNVISRNRELSLGIYLYATPNLRGGGQPSEESMRKMREEVSTRFEWRFLIHESDRKWTEEERMKMEESALLTGCRKDTVMPGVGAVAAFVEAHRETLIQRVYSVVEITDCLKSKNMISDETYSNIQAAGTSQERMRVLYEALQSGGRAVKEEFYGILKEKLPFLVKELESHSHGFHDYAKPTKSLLTSVFNPEAHLEDNSDAYRFVCPHAGQFQCKITSLVFEMEGKGVVLYRIVSWDTRLLDGLGQMQPAGPLYNIDCFEGSISHLHLPHCETSEENQVELAMAHFTGANVEVIKPLKVTNTHVVIKIQGLSLFGLLLSKIFPARPISAQVLFFYKPIADMKNLKQLHIHLLPGNVPVREVQNQHMNFKHITTSSTADTLVPDRNYKPTCDHYTPEPEVATFKCVYGPNYHPTFVVYLEANHVTVSLLDENDVEVWRPHQLYLTGCRKDTVMPGVDAGAAFVEAHRETLIQRVYSVVEITDCLKSKNMISDETYSNIRAAGTSQEKMRVLYEALQSGGRAVKDEFCGILKEKLPFLVEELESGPSQA